MTTTTLTSGGSEAIAIGVNPRSIETAATSTTTLDLPASLESQSTRQLVAELARRMKRDRDVYVPRESHSLGSFVSFAADHFGFSVERFLSRARPQCLAEPRMAAMAAARKLGRFSLKEVAKAFQRGEHGTIMNAEARCADDERMRQMRDGLLMHWGIACEAEG
jgi:chromosomal replication initiation ATPase DnaA